METESLIKKFGIFLKDIRTERKITQEKLAEMCDLDRTYISLLERGGRQPSITTLYKISIALNLKLSSFIKLFEEECNI